MVVVLLTASVVGDEQSELFDDRSLKCAGFYFVFDGKYKK